MRATGAQQYVTAVLLLACLFAALAAQDYPKATEEARPSSPEHQQSRGQKPAGPAGVSTRAAADEAYQYGPRSAPNPGPYHPQPQPQPHYGGWYPSQTPYGSMYSGYAQPYRPPQQPPRVDPVGQTYLLNTIRRTLDRPDSTTLAELAANMRLGSNQKRTANDTDSKKSLKEEDTASRQLPWLSPKHNQATPKAPRGAPPKAKAPAPRAEQVSTATANKGPDGYGGSWQPTAKVDLSFRGLNAFEQRFANGGNQLSRDPPDQGLCVGNGFVMESVNNVLRVYDAGSGRPLLSPVDLNTFYGYRPDFDRDSFSFGPSLVDPSCVFDEDSRRWFHVAIVSERSPFGDFTSSFLEIAVSETADPTGAWKLYRIPASGEPGAPNTGCASGVCLPDYPQLAVWKSAVIITANEFDLPVPGTQETFYGALVYAVDKAALLSGARQANTALVPTFGGANDEPVATLQPARQAGPCATPNTFLIARPLGTRGNTLQLFSLQGTETLSSGHARVTLDWVQRSVQLDTVWEEPPAADQQPGDNPLGEGFYKVDVIPKLSAGDGRMGSLSFADDRLFCTWGSGVTTEAGNTVAGIAWAVVDPRRPAKALQSGLLRAPGSNHLLWPYMAVRPGGQGVVAFSISGPDYHPSPAYAVLSREGLGQLTVITPGVGVLDTFTGYNFPFVSRFGDYSAAVLDEQGAFWVASEYVAQSCTVDEFFASFPSTCGGTRAPLANWATRVTRIRLDHTYAGP